MSEYQRRNEGEQTETNPNRGQRGSVQAESQYLRYLRKFSGCDAVRAGRRRAVPPAFCADSAASLSASGNFLAELSSFISISSSKNKKIRTTPQKYCHSMGMF